MPSACWLEIAISYEKRYHWDAKGCKAVRFSLYWNQRKAGRLYDEVGGENVVPRESLDAMAGGHVRDQAMFSLVRNGKASVVIGLILAAIVAGFLIYVSL